MKKILFILLFPILLFGQVTFQKTKNQQVWYDATKEHGTVWTDFDSSCIKMGKTSTGNFYLIIYDRLGNKTFSVDSTGISHVDSLKIGTGVWMRNFYQSGNDIGIIFYNTSLSRIDTVFAKQP